MKRIPEQAKQVGKNVLWGMLMVCMIVTLVSVVVQRLTGNQQPMILGWGSAIIQTGSMEPDIPIGSLIIIQEKDDYKAGDVVTYADDTGRAVTHRILSVAGNTIITKGDANNVEDEPFNKSQIIGRVQLVIPNILIIAIPFIFIVLAWSIFILLKFVKRKAEEK